MSGSKMIITDNIDLSQKKIITKDNFYSNKNNTFIETQKISSDYSGFESNSNKSYYALVSTADKIINNRNYSYDSWLKTVKDRSWVKPYSKPILYNHDLYYSLPNGRITNAFMIEHKNKQVVASSIAEELPADVINFYDSIGAFDEGTGSVIASFKPNSNLAYRLENSLDVTVSQSSFMNKAVCNICGKDYFGSECIHFPGHEYEIEDSEGNKSKKVCIVNTYDYEPIELSFVNIPANDTSVVYIYEKEDSKVIKNKDCKNNNIQDTKNEPEDKKEKIGEAKEDNMEENQKLKNTIKKMLDQKLILNEETSKSFSDLFEKIPSDQLDNLNAIIDYLLLNKGNSENKTKDEKEELKETEVIQTNKKEETKEKINLDSKENTTNSSESKENINDSTNKNGETLTEDNKKAPIEKFYNKENTKDNKMELSHELQALVNMFK